MKTVWIYVDTNKKVGNVDHLKVFASTDAADRWFKKNDPAGVAFRYEVLTAEAELPVESRAAGGKKKTVSNGELTAIFYRKMRTCSECPYSGTPISIVPAGRRSEWRVLTAPYVVRRYPRCAERVEEVEKELQKFYGLARE
jgi:ribosomal protein L34E